MAERRSINISPRTATFKIALLTYPALDIGNKSFIKFTALDIRSRLSKLEKSDEQDPLHKWIGYYNHHVIEFRKFFKWLYASHLPQKKTITSWVYSFCLFLLWSRVVVIFKQ